MAATRTLLVDDHPMFRAGLRVVLERAVDLEVVAEAGSASQAMQIAKLQVLELAIVDVVVPESGGAALVCALHALQPACKILALSMLDEPVRVAEMFQAGASGYALKSQSSDELVEAIKLVLGGVRYLAPQIAGDVVDRLIAGEPALARLTSRERGVFDLLILGKSNAGVGRMLAIATCTVEAHRRHIMHKLEARSIVDLVRIALRHGVIGPDART